MSCFTQCVRIDMTARSSSLEQVTHSTRYSRRDSVFSMLMEKYIIVWLAAYMALSVFKLDISSYKRTLREVLLRDCLCNARSDLE
jgi:hypothetical protein